MQWIIWAVLAAGQGTCFALMVISGSDGYRSLSFAFMLASLWFMGISLYVIFSWDNCKKALNKILDKLRS